MKFVLPLIALFAFTLTAEAAGRSHYNYRQRTVVRTSETSSASFSIAPLNLEMQDAFAYLNAQRAARGLPLYVEDPVLSRAATAAATFRAANRQFKHLSNEQTNGHGDFVFLPPGVTARAGGCGCWNSYLGFMACGDDYKVSLRVGAGWARGADGRVYCHLFIK